MQQTRNTLRWSAVEACHRGCIEPRFTTLPEGQDPVAFILSCNVNRRHLSKGQQAMAVAKAHTLTTKLSLRQTAAACNVNRERVRQANTVIDFAPDLADGVLAGSLPLNEASAEARKRKEAKETDEAKFSRPPCEQAGHTRAHETGVRVARPFVRECISNSASGSPLPCVECRTLLTINRELTSRLTIPAVRGEQASQFGAHVPPTSSLAGGTH